MKTETGLIGNIDTQCDLRLRAVTKVRIWNVWSEWEILEKFRSEEHERGQIQYSTGYDLPLKLPQDEEGVGLAMHPELPEAELSSVDGIRVNLIVKARLDDLYW